MTVKNIIEQAEKMFGRQPEQYMFQLINVALNEIAAEKQHNTNKQTSKQARRQTNKQASNQASKQAHKQTNTNKY